MGFSSTGYGIIDVVFKNSLSGKPTKLNSWLSWAGIAKHKTPLTIGEFLTYLHLFLNVLLYIKCKVAHQLLKN